MKIVPCAYKYRFYPTPEQAALFARTFGCARKVWNVILGWREAQWNESGTRIGFKKASSKLTEIKTDPELFYLNEVSSVVLQQAIRHQQAAIIKYAKAKNAASSKGSKGCKVGRPKFKSVRARQSATYVGTAFRLDGQRLTLAKMREPLDIHWSRELPETAKITSVTVSKEPDGAYYVSFQCEDIKAPLLVLDTEVGVDVGIKDIVALSTGEKIANPRHLLKEEKRQKYLQRELARKQRGSNRYKMARMKCAKHYAKIRNRRKDTTHKLTSKLIAENQRIVVEDLNVSGMMKNHHLAKHIGDANFSEIVRQLTYKAAWYGRELIVIDRWTPTSKTCSDCGHVLDTLPLSVRDWTCPECGSVHDRDINAAENILAAGLRSSHSESQVFALPKALSGYENTVVMNKAAGHAVSARGELVRLEDAHVSSSRLDEARISTL